jgi:hypothetical protein
MLVYKVYYRKERKCLSKSIVYNIKLSLVAPLINKLINTFLKLKE